MCASSSRPGFCDVGHEWQLRQGSNGSRPVVTKSQHNQEAGCTCRTSCRRTLQVTQIADVCWKHVSSLAFLTYTRRARWHKSCCLCCRDALHSIFDEVRVVDVLDSGDVAHLSLMKRPDLGVTFTKLHCWTLTHYSKCVFMDADTLVRNKPDKSRTLTQWKFKKISLDLGSSVHAVI